MFRLQRTGSAFNSPAPAVVKTVLFVVVILMTLQALQQLAARIRALKDLKRHDIADDQQGG